MTYSKINLHLTVDRIVTVRRALPTPYILNKNLSVDLGVQDPQ